ncbi:hypothetical protein FJI00_23375 [Salmonella enterica]|nr:hypothetical protein [Salmonella enterica]EBH2940347.1 hypothetical protein [Salmonella enterica]ECW7440948.1 hypothetical protein [Salmonella enterica]EHJ1282521.1 hypothetical protein [Salmonella enterica]ELS9574965.1 hypothetical protein [Salmonella enterica]
MKGNCADLYLGGVVKLPGLTASSWATRPLPRSGTGQGVTSPVTPTRAKRPPPPCKAGFGGLSDDTAAGAVARHNGPVERAGWRVATGRARFIRVLGGWPRSGQRPYRHDENWITDVILVEWLCMAL